MIAHKEELQQIRGELSQSKLAFKRLLSKFERLKKIPLGYRSAVRKRRDLSSLSQTGGHAKAQKRLARTIVGAETVGRVQQQNAEEGRSRRLYGDKNSQMESGRVFASLLSRTEMESMLETPKMTVVGEAIVNQYLDKIGKLVSAAKILETCDRSGITVDGYSAVYKTFKGAVKSAGKGLRISCLPNPHQVNLLRRQMNSKLDELIGSFYSINDTFIVPSNSKSKNKDPVKVELNEINSFFADVEKVQATMVQLYGIPLKVCALIRALPDLIVCSTGSLLILYNDTCFMSRGVLIHIEYLAPGVRRRELQSICISQYSPIFV